MAELPPDSDDIIPVRNFPQVAVSIATTAIAVVVAYLIGGIGLVYYLVPIAISATVLFQVCVLRGQLSLIDRRLADVRSELHRVHGAVSQIPTPTVPLAVSDPIEGLIQTDDLLGAITLYRQRTGAGLREAKDAVEAMRGRL